jgi:hypothetical protein
MLLLHAAAVAVALLGFFFFLVKQPHKKNSRAMSTSRGPQTCYVLPL